MSNKHIIKFQELDNHYEIIIVGAGISGLTLAERYASLGKKVLVIEARDHIGGNCHDYVNEHGILVSTYGPHYFHTNDEEVWEYINQFAEWNPYEHRVIAHVNGKKVPVPINIDTINLLHGTSLKNEAETLQWLKENVPEIANPKNAEEAAIGRVGKEIYEKIFKGYTKKQWDKDPTELDPEITNRIPLRTNHDDRYFTDKYQALPKYGYTKFFESMVRKHPVKLLLSTEWDNVNQHIKQYEKIFFTGKIDSYFKEKFGSLEYRSLRFEFETLPQEHFQTHSQENYPHQDVPFTRIVEFKHATGQKHPMTTISREYPTWDGEPYYPVLSERNKKLYKKYQTAANQLEKNGVYFVGRLANYKYFNMDQAFKNALDLFRRLELN